jgi:S1-C subfamily serine protease
MRSADYRHKQQRTIPMVCALGLCSLALGCGATATSVPTAPGPQTAPTLVAASPPAPQPAPTVWSLQDAAELAKRYTVLVVATGRGAVGAGSGISLGGGKVVTNNHVVADMTDVAVRFADGRQERVRVVRTDRRRDLALLQSSFLEEPAALFGDSRALRPAESLLAVGFPESLQIGAQDAAVTNGIFSALWQSRQGVGYVQTNALVNHGNSGGPLADSRGRVVGVVTWGVSDAPGLNFAVASDEVQAFLNAAASTPEPSGQAFSPTIVPRVPTRSPAVQRAPTVAPTQPPLKTDGPADAVRAFYTAIGGHDFQTAWELLGPSFRAKNQYDGWVKGFETTRSVRTIGSRTASESGDSAIVDFTIVATDTAGATTVDKTFQGTWTLKRMDGAWKLDVPSVRQAS